MNYDKIGKNELVDEINRLQNKIESLVSGDENGSTSDRDSAIHEIISNSGAMFMDAGAAFIIMDGAGVVDCNRKALMTFGFGKEEIRGSSLWDFSPVKQPNGENSKERALKFLDSVEPGKSTRFFWKFQRKNGSVFDAEVSLTTFTTAGKEFITAFVSDITAQKASEKALRKSEELLYNFTNSAFDSFVQLDTNLNLVDINKKGLEIIGKSAYEVIGKSISEIMPDAKSSGRYDRFLKVLKTGEPFSENYSITHPEMGECHYILKAFKVGDGVGIISTDITRVKKSEKELKQAYNEISQLKDKLEAENVYLREEIRLEYSHESIVGDSQPIKIVLKNAEQVAPTDSTVLIQGETGTGKELLARAIHDMSRRKKNVMIKVNCAALPSTLIESELFGREKGAYTGALSKQIGRFEVADGSTIFLDEISELPIELQPKLLRVLQEGQFERLGSSNTIEVHVRIIAATNKKLKKLVDKGKFREDLFYRLNIFPIIIPPLRDRIKDIPQLVWSFVKEFESKMGKKVTSIPEKDMKKLQAYQWPGNIRELKNTIERAMILNSGNVLHIQIPEPGQSDGLLDMTMEEMQKNHIKNILEKTGGKIRGKNGAAELLGMKPSTLESRMKKLGVKRRK